MPEPQGIPAPILRCLPLRWRAACEALPIDVQRQVTELRLRIGRPVGLTLRDGTTRWLGPAGVVRDPSRVPRFSREDGEGLMQSISDSSVYALEEQLRQGYATLPGGHRIGFCGEVVMLDRQPRTTKHIGSFTVRIARAATGCGDPVLRHIVHRGRPRSALIVSPPGCGKTTLLRDLARLLSTGCPRRGWAGCNVAVVDERSEIAAAYKGVPAHDLGPRVDVVDGAPKSFAVLQLLRGMAPDVIVTDEIGKPEDAAAIQEALHGGVAVLASAHGATWRDPARRPGLRSLFDPVVFETIVVLSDRRGPGTVESIIDIRAGSQIGHKSSISSIHIG